jgi:ABC-type amino acid transport system permease subunit
VTDKQPWQAAEMCGILVLPNFKEALMDTLRLFLALALFFLGLYLLLDLFWSGFSLAVLIAAVACFVLAHGVKPRRREGEEFGTWYDMLELMIEIPFRAIALAVRGLGRLFKGDAGGLDL